jgi:urease gamma subunit
MADHTIQTALIVIAIAVSVQTLLLLTAAVAGVLAWRRMEQQVGVRYAALAARVDDAVAQTRRAVDAVDRVSSQASDVLGKAGHVVGSIAAMAAIPGHLVRALAVSASKNLFANWRRGGPRRVGA